MAKHNLSYFPSQNRNLNWNILWKDLESWSILDRNTEIGFFELHNFSNKNWIYVGKPLSQCILPLKAIKKLPTFFEKAGLVPNNEVSDKRLRELVKIYASQHLNISKKLIETIATPENELGHSIVKLIKRKYLAWDGTSDIYDHETKILQKGLTVAQLRLCFKYKSLTGVFKPYFRLYSELDFPEDLCFNKEHQCYTHGMAWSKPMHNLPFKNGLELIDPFNKWKALFPKKGVRIFIKGEHFNLNDWVEILKLKFCSKILVLVEREYVDSVEKWGDNIGRSNFKRHPNFSAIPNHNLYEVKSPIQSHPSIETLH